MIEFLEGYDVIFLFSGEFPMEVAIATTVIMLAICAAVFILKGIGLHSLARRGGYKHAWFAYIPFFNNYLMAQLGGEVSFLGKKVKHLPLFFALSDALTCTAYALQVVSEFALCFGGAEFEQELGVYVYMTLPPDTLGWAYYMREVMLYLAPVLFLVYSFLLIVVLFAFFRRYAAKNSMIFAIASVFVPVSQGILVFAVRKNMPVDYVAYMRSQREAQYRRYQAHYGQNPYATNQRYGDPRNDPFSEFSQGQAQHSGGEPQGGERKPSDFPENDEFFG